MDHIVNMKIICHPMNWFIVWLVLFGAALGYAIVDERLTVTLPAPATT